MDKFNPEDLKNPLYEYSQVVTVYDLMHLYNNLVAESKNLKWWEWLKKHDVEAAYCTVYEILSWIEKGKPRSQGTGE